MLLPGGRVRVLLFDREYVIGLRRDGTRDRGVGSNGTVKPPSGSRVTAAIAPGRGRGFLLVSTRGRRGRVAVDAFTGSGRIDRSYGSRGRRTLPVAGYPSVGHSAGGGALWLAGDGFAARLAPSGAVRWLTKLDPEDSVREVAPLGTGAVVLVTRAAANRLALVRLSATGRTVDRFDLGPAGTFGGLGASLATFGRTALVAGSSGGRPVVTKVRYGAIPVATLPAVARPAGFAIDVSAAHLQRDGRILLAGDAYADYEPRMALARLNPDGSPDRTFGHRGLRRIPLPDLDRASTNALAVRGSTAVVAGTMDDEGGDIREDYGARWPAVARVKLR